MILKISRKFVSRCAVANEAAFMAPEDELKAILNLRANSHDLEYRSEQ